MYRISTESSQLKSSSILSSHSVKGVSSFRLLAQSLAMRGGRGSQDFAHSVKNGISAIKKIEGPPLLRPDPFMMS